MQHEHAHLELAELAGNSGGLEPGVPVADRIRALGRRSTIIRGQRPAQRPRHSRADGTADRAPHGTPHPATDVPAHAAPNAQADPKAHAHAATGGL